MPRPHDRAQPGEHKGFECLAGKLRKSMWVKPQAVGVKYFYNIDETLLNEGTVCWRAVLDLVDAALKKRSRLF